MIADIMLNASENVQIEKKDKSPWPRFDLVTLVFAGERAIHSAIQFKGCCREILARSTLLIKKLLCRYGYKLGDLQYQVDPTGINFQRSRKARAQILRRTVMFLITALP